MGGTLVDEQMEQEQNRTEDVVNLPGLEGLRVLSHTRVFLRYVVVSPDTFGVSCGLGIRLRHTATSVANH